MKLAVIGDIHSNHMALKRCIEHAFSQNAEEFIFLGDYISDCPYPHKTMQIIYEMKDKYHCSFIRGNREDYMLHHRENPNERWTYSSASGNLLYTYENLTKEDLDFYESLDIKGIYRKEGYPPFRYCHGSLTSSKELLLPDNENLAQGAPIARIRPFWSRPFRACCRRNGTLQKNAKVRPPRSGNTSIKSGVIRIGRTPRFFTCC